MAVAYPLKFDLANHDKLRPTKRKTLS